MKTKSKLNCFKKKTYLDFLSHFFHENQTITNHMSKFLCISLKNPILLRGFQLFYYMNSF
jgi:hypothetical protein